MKSRILKTLEVAALIAVPVTLALCAYFQFNQSALFTIGVTLAAVFIFFANYEASKPSLRQIMPTVVLAALAAAGRILFAPLPNFKPVSAICIIAGATFGRQAGFMVGALAALTSNFFFGQGPWTPWQMYAWGMIGYTAGILADHNLFKPATNREQAKGTVPQSNPTQDKGTVRLLASAQDNGTDIISNPAQGKEVPSHVTKEPPLWLAWLRQTPLYLYGFLSALAYGFLLNTWHIVGFVHPITWETALIAYAASLFFDLSHGIATVVFLMILYLPWQKKLKRIKQKYT